jgi:hypothetical protein
MAISLNEVSIGASAGRRRTESAPDRQDVAVHLRCL